MVASSSLDTRGQQVACLSAQLPSSLRLLFTAAHVLLIPFIHSHRLAGGVIFLARVIALPVTVSIAVFARLRQERRKAAPAPTTASVMELSSITDTPIPKTAEDKPIQDTIVIQPGRTTPVVPPRRATAWEAPSLLRWPSSRRESSARRESSVRHPSHSQQRKNRASTSVVDCDEAIGAAATTADVPPPSPRTTDLEMAPPLLMNSCRSRTLTLPPASLPTVALTDNSTLEEEDEEEGL